MAAKLTALIRDGRLHEYVGNQLVDGNDPSPSTRKDLRVKYLYKGIEHAITVLEREDLTLPTRSDLSSPPPGRD